MIKDIFHYIYCMSIPSTMFVLVFVCCIWNFFTTKINHKNLWKILNTCLFLFWFASIVYMTVFSRGSKAEINLTPFHFITQAIKTGNEEFFRTGWMNILLFVPGGMWISYSVRKYTKPKCVVQIIFLMLISVSIEIVQWYYQLGMVEIDDVICNTFGAIIGVTSVFWAEKFVAYLKLNLIKLFNLIKQN